MSAAPQYGQSTIAANISFLGDRLIASSLGSFSGSRQTSPLNYYDFVRGSTEWATGPLNTPAGMANPTASNVTAASPDLRMGIFEYEREPKTDIRDRGFFIRPLPAGNFDEVEHEPVEVGPTVSRAALEHNPVAPENSPARYIPFVSTPSASPDLSHVLFMLEGPTLARGPQLLDFSWPGDTTLISEGQGYISLYEYVGAHNSAPRLVGVDSAGHLISECGTSLGFPRRGFFTALSGEDVYNAISKTGSRIVFTSAGPCPEGIGPPVNELFVRDERSPGVVNTINISEPTAGPGGDCVTCDLGQPSPAVFQGASEDGSKVVFLSQQHLLPGSSETNLYEYDFDAEKGQRVTLIAPEVAGVSRISEDGSHVYFVAKGRLTTIPNSSGDTAQFGADNLYVEQGDTARPGDHISFIGVLAANDTADWAQEDRRPFDVTPDGQFAVFTSHAPLTHENASNTSQVFEYDAQTGELIDISRPQSGFNNVASDATIAYANYAETDNPAGQPTFVSDDGAIVVFQSDSALTPYAAQGYGNVYEYHVGRLNLISDGQDRNSLLGGISTTSLIGMNGSGRDIFFTSGDSLIPQDGDTQEDIYDAREGGGFLAAAPSACEGDGCQGSFAPTPGLATPISATQPAGEQSLETLPATKSVPKPKPKPKPKRVAGGKHKRRALAKKKHGHGRARAHSGRSRKR